MTQKEAEWKAERLKERWKDIITDAIRTELLVDDVCLGCGRRNCGACPAGTTTAWNPQLRIDKI